MLEQLNINDEKSENGIPEYRNNGCLPSDFISSSIFWVPDWIQESAWIEHVPFAFWLVETLRPRMIVELGTKYGVSYMAFCQAVCRLGLETKCFAVDTWNGDEQTGFYGEEVFETLSPAHQRTYSQFSRLVRSTFDDSAPYFEDGSIDLLHIDGLHTYDAAKHDFENWFPKLSSYAVALFHDTNVRERNFGVFKLWRELCNRWPGFEFFHGHGLGVLGVGPKLAPAIKNLFTAAEAPVLAVPIRQIYSHLGSGLSYRQNLENVHEALKVQATQISQLQVELTKLKAELSERLNDRERLIRQIDSIHASVCWRLTGPLRWLHKQASRARNAC
jgi:hypothetical protein